jgi:uncharacterized protein YsxB (DUF464 family)
LALREGVFNTNLISCEMTAKNSDLACEAVSAIFFTCSNAAFRQASSLLLRSSSKARAIDRPISTGDV